MIAHSQAVRGIFIDAVNTKIASASADGTLKLWNFTSHKLLADVACGSAITRLEGHRESGLAIVVGIPAPLRAHHWPGGSWFLFLFFFRVCSRPKQTTH